MAQIYELIGKAMADIGAIGKDSVNQQQKFRYRGIDAVMNALNPVLQKWGLFCVPEVLNQVREERATNNGGTLKYSILTVKYTMYAPDGSSVSAVVLGEGMDSGDKASNKAMSVAFKYAMFQLFCIPTEEMVDPDSETPPDNYPGKREAAPPAQEAKKPAHPAPQAPAQGTAAKTMKTLMNSALVAYGVKEAPVKFNELMEKAGCTRETMTEETYDLIHDWIMDDIRKNAAKGAA